MSWNTKFVARTKGAAVEALAADRLVPEGIKLAIEGAITNLTRQPDQAVLVRTQGHIDENGGRGEIEVLPVRIVEDAGDSKDRQSDTRG